MVEEGKRFDHASIVRKHLVSAGCNSSARATCKAAALCFTVQFQPCQSIAASFYFWRNSKAGEQDIFMTETAVLPYPRRYLIRLAPSPG